MGILLIDIGNAKIKTAYSKDYSTVRDLFSVYTQSNEEDIEIKINEVLSNHPIEGAVLCSVVPSASSIVKRILEEKGIKVMEVNSQIELGISLNYENPESLGADRIAGAVGAFFFHCLPNMTSAIVIDFGTAITVDLINFAGEYLGGAIMPGVLLFCEALKNKTELLPEVDFEIVNYTAGLDTIPCIQLGSQASIVGGINYLINRFSKLISGDLDIILTGGDALQFKDMFEFKYIHYPKLVLRALAKLWQLNSKGNQH
ncbi:type III pantothenate kinase [bacterium]|nr:type III pantothenate kinase [bacterium]